MMYGSLQRTSHSTQMALHKQTKIISKDGVTCHPYANTQHTVYTARTELSSNDTGEVM